MNAILTGPVPDPPIGPTAAGPSNRCTWWAARGPCAAGPGDLWAHVVFEIHDTREDALDTTVDGKVRTPLLARGRWRRDDRPTLTCEAHGTLPILTKLVDDELTEAGAQDYRNAARRLKWMRQLAAGSNRSAEVDHLIAELREIHRRRPRAPTRVRSRWASLIDFSLQEHSENPTRRSQSQDP